MFFDIQIDGRDSGRIVMELFDEVVPLTARNFYSIASGQNQQGYTYRGTIFHRIIPQFMIQVCKCSWSDCFIIVVFRVETSRILMAQVEPVYMVAASMMKTSWWSTGLLVSSPWLTLDPTPMELSSSSPRWRPSGWTTNMLCLAELMIRRASTLSNL